MYEKLAAEQISETLDTLTERISERFPDASLAGVSKELARLASESGGALAEIEKPRPVLRLALAATILAGLTAVGWLARTVSRFGLTADAAGLIQAIEASFNIVVVTSGVIFYLVTLEQRLKRNRALKDLHKLRSIVHVIDMHQLTKDPSAVLGGGEPTAHSPKRTFSSFELMRYLDYCSELLSLTGKVAALYAQVSPDAVVVNAVSDLEQLTTSLSQKIWQKILIAQLQARDQSTAEAAPQYSARSNPDGTEPGALPS
jgi:hypothetical protein